MNPRASFTLIELLITIGIVTILSVVVVLTLNPAQLLRQARDSTRLSDIDTLNRAINLHQVDVSGGTYGNASTTYVSIPDSSATCANLGLPALPSGYTYRCVTSANLRKVDGAGWIPVNFTQISAGAPFGALPVDPTNSTTTGTYYTYLSGGSWALTSLLESDKYLKQSAASDGGYDPGRYEKGDDLQLTARGQGLVAWWRLDEKSGFTASDSSGQGRNGTIVNQGSPTWIEGKVNGALQFDGVDDRVDTPVHSTHVPPAAWTLHAWIRNAVSANQVVLGRANDRPGIQVGSAGGFRVAVTPEVGPTFSEEGSSLVNNNTWHHVVATYDGTSIRGYVDGVREIGPSSASQYGLVDTQTFRIGNRDTPLPFAGIIDDVRIYSRVLSAVEIKAIYDATK